MSAARSRLSHDLLTLSIFSLRRELLVSIFDHQNPVGISRTIYETTHSDIAIFRSISLKKREERPESLKHDEAKDVGSRDLRDS